MADAKLAHARSVLELDADYTLDEAKASYRKKALRVHPDKPTGNTEEFQEIGHAYEIVQDYLSSPAAFKRKHDPQSHFAGGGHSHGHGHGHGFGGGMHGYSAGGFFYSFGGGGPSFGFPGGGGYGAGRGGGGYRHPYQEESSDEDYEYGTDYEEEEATDEEEEEEEGEDDYLNFMFESLFNGGKGSRQEYSHFRHQPAEPKESPAERQERLRAAVKAAEEAEQRRQREAARLKEQRQEQREEEMRQAAKRRVEKTANKKEKFAASRAGAESRAMELLLASQQKRSTVFAAARRGDVAAVKHGVWELNVAADGVELLPGLPAAHPEKAATPSPPTPEPPKAANGTANGAGSAKGSKGKRTQGATNGQPSTSTPRPDSEKENVAAQPASSTGNGTSSLSKAAKKKKGKKGSGASPAVSPPGAFPSPASTTNATPPTHQTAKPAEQVPKSAPTPLPASSQPKQSKAPKTDYSETLLIIAAKQGLTELSKWLINQSATPEDRDKAQFAPFHHALLRGHIELVEFYLSDNQDLSDLPEPPFDQARSDDAPGVFPTPPGETLLSLAVSSGKAKLVEMMSAYGTVEDAWEQWVWIEEMLSGPPRGNEEQQEWEAVKWALTTVPDFPRMPGYEKKRGRGR